MSDNPLDNPNKSFKDKFDILVQLFLVKSETKWTNSDFARENFAVKRLLKKYPDFDFFYTLNELYNKYNSFLGLQTKYWSNYLDDKWEEFKINKEKNKEYKLSENPVINIETEKRKARNVIEFLS